MQIAVRSKPVERTVCRQMGGSFIVLVGGKRIVHGINPYRALAHFPWNTHPKYTGFVGSGYAKGMNVTDIGKLHLLEDDLQWNQVKETSQSLAISKER